MRDAEVLEQLPCQRSPERPASPAKVPEALHRAHVGRDREGPALDYLAARQAADDVAGAPRGVPAAAASASVSLRARRDRQDRLHPGAGRGPRAPSQPSSQAPPHVIDSQSLVKSHINHPHAVLLAQCSLALIALPC